VYSWLLCTTNGQFLITPYAVLGGNGRVFNSVFARAQEILRKTFGMEIHELMTRVERDKALAPENNTVNATSGKAAKGGFPLYSISCAKLSLCFVS